MGDAVMGERFVAATEKKALEWPHLTALEGVKSRKRAILWVEHRDAAGQPLALSLDSRVSLAGLASKEVGELLRELSCVNVSDRPEGRAWRARGHEGLKVAVLPAGGNLAGGKEQLAEVAAGSPHALVVAGATAAAWGAAAREAVRGFKGIVFVLEDSCASSTTARLLHDLGVTTRWQPEGCCASAKITDPSSQVLVQVPLPEALEEEEEASKERFLHNVEIRSPLSAEMYPEAPYLAELLEEQLAPLYDDEFGADLGNLGQSIRGYNLRLSLMVDRRPEGEVPSLLGFVVYKVWGEPQPCVSVCAVGVPSKYRGYGYGRKLMAVAEEQAALSNAAAGRQEPGLVCLRSFPSSVRFYSRLGYEKTGEGEALPEGMAEDDDDGPCVPMVRRCTATPSKPAPVCAAKALDPWSPRRSRHLEDGPTWMPVEKFLLPPCMA